ncbi:MAG: HAMP domain-containing protein [Clostridia bacterium]|nr:HAMP domain-containing protein [Clostridia bacterium]
MRKIWNSIPITRKLMLVTIIVFLVFCVIIFVGQIAFFENYYTYIRYGEVKKAVSEFEEVCADYSDENTLRSKMSEISEDGECYMMVMDEGGAVKYTLSYDMTVMTALGENIRVSLDDVVNNKDFSELELAVGKEITVSIFGTHGNIPSRTFFPLRIASDNAEWRISRPEGREVHVGRGPADRPRIDNIREISGVITSIVLPSEQVRNINSERLAASRAAMEWVSGGRVLSEPYEYIEPENGERFCVVVRSLVNTSGDVIFAIAPLNMVTEAVSVSRHMYYFCFVLAMIAACFVGIIFAKVATNPIIRITRVTKRMAELDFSDRCEYSSNDEIGELAKNINVLSDSLDSAINELQRANEKLVKDIERERALEESRREFVAAASHELKTPLGIIRAYTEALMDDISANKGQHYTQVIVNETEKMDRLILDMLDNSKYEVGAEKPVISEYDIVSVISGVKRRFDEIVKQKGIEVRENYPASGAVCSFDVDMIERVITNFIANAVSNTPDNGKIILSVSQADGKTIVCVENSGSAIPESDIEHIWDKFYKADKSRRRSSGGTGLGLSIAKNILNLHNAEYFAENTEIGVKFSFIIK